MKILPVEQRCYMRTDRQTDRQIDTDSQTDRHEDVHSLFLKFCERT